MGVLKPGDRILVSNPFTPTNCRSLGHQDILALMFFNNYLPRDIASAEQSARKGKSIKFGNSMPMQAISSSWLSWRICKLTGHLIPSSMVSHSSTFLMVDVDGICHVASPFHFKPQDNERDLLLPAIKGTTSILNSALKAPSVKRIVITSTMATISHIGKGVWPGKVYNVCNSFA
jgi:hypothetical protein